MATPGSFTDPAWEARDIHDPKVIEAFEQGLDVDTPEMDVYATEIAKGSRSGATSMRSEEKTLEEAPVEQPERDPDIVDWDGPDDPQNPLNWPEGRKWGLIACLGTVTLVTYANSTTAAVRWLTSSTVL